MSHVRMQIGEAFFIYLVDDLIEEIYLLDSLCRHFLNIKLIDHPLKCFRLVRCGFYNLNIV